MKRIYFKSDNMRELVHWLSQKPDGRFQVLVGSENLTFNAFGTLELYLRDKPSLARWINRSFDAGNLRLRAIPVEPDLPEGVELETTH